jgi:hypothetical protein
MCSRSLRATEGSPRGTTEGSPRGTTEGNRLENSLNGILFLPLRSIAAEARIVHQAL